MCILLPGRYYQSVREHFCNYRLAQLCAIAHIESPDSVEVEYMVLQVKGVREDKLPTGRMNTNLRPVVKFCGFNLFYKFFRT